MLYVCNAFSLSMLPDWAVDGPDAPGANLHTEPVADPMEYVVRCIVDGHAVVSAVGHADTAAVFSRILGMPVAMCRRSVTLTPDDEMLIGQIIGGRLPEGATTLPDDVTIRWLSVTLV